MELLKFENISIYNLLLKKIEKKKKYQPKYIFCPTEFIIVKKTGR